MIVRKYTTTCNSCILIMYSVHACLQEVIFALYFQAQKKPQMKTQITVSKKNITGNSGTLCTFTACVCICLFYYACGNGTSGQDHRNPRTDRIRTSTEAEQFRSATFHIMIRYHRCMTNHHFWHCGCINCLHTTSSITRLGGVKSVQIKSASQIFQSADKLETVALTKKLMSEESQ